MRGSRLSAVVRIVLSSSVPVLFLLVIIVGFFGATIAPFDPSEINLGARYQLPFQSVTHILGTDQLGRDILSRILAGAQLSLSLTTIVISLAGFAGVLIGMASGYAGGRTDAFLMRCTDAMLALPGIMLALLMVAVLGTNFWSVTIALLLVSWARYARFVRGEVLTLRSCEFVDAAVVCGTHPLKILWVHFFPNIVNAVVVLFTLDIGRIILLESSLAFLGLGLPADSGAWGASIAEGKPYLQTAPWVPLMPALAMMTTIMISNGFGNWVSGRLDPRVRTAEQ